MTPEITIINIKKDYHYSYKLELKCTEQIYVAVSN